MQMQHSVKSGHGLAPERRNQFILGLLHWIIDIDNINQKISTWVTSVNCTSNFDFVMVS